MIVEEINEEMVEEASTDEPTSEDDFDLAEELGGSKEVASLEDGLDDEPESAEESEEVEEDPEDPEEEVQEEPTDEVEQPTEETYSIKVNGEDREFSLDDLKKYANLGMASQDKFEEAAEGRRKLQEVVSTLGDNPWQVLEKMGKDPVEMAEKFLADKYKLEMMSDEEKEVYNIRKENEQYKRQSELSTRQQQEAQLKQATEIAKANYEKEFTTALEAVELPKTPATLKRVADYVQQGLTTGIEVTASEAASLVAEDLMNEQKEVMSALDAEKLEKVLGKDLLKKLKKHDLKKIKDPQAGNRAVKGKKTRKGKAPSMKSLASVFDSIESGL